MKSLTEQQRKVELFLFVRTDNVWIKKKVNVTCRYRRKATTNTKKLLIQFIKNIQHSYSIRNPGGKPGREFDRIVFFFRKCHKWRLGVVCARLGEDFCQIDLQADGKHA